MLDEMRAHLSQIEVDSNGDAARELDALSLLAVEREQLAVVGYGGETVLSRVERLNAEGSARRTVAHALRWAARDERSHAVLARALLFRSKRLRIKLTLFFADFGGLVAGWCSAVLQHTTLSRAPFSRLAAHVISTFGKLAGKVPQTATAALKTQSFKAFCEFQTAAEQTAALSWKRLAAVLERTGNTPAAQIASRIALDENNHERVLKLLALSFDEGDNLTTSPSDLAQQLGDVSAAFVPHAERNAASSVAAGGTVFVRTSIPAMTGEPAALRALLHSTLIDTKLLDATLNSMPRHARIAIKTTFMMGYDRSDPSPWVDPHLLDALAQLFRERGAEQVTVLEAPNHYDVFYQGRSVQAVAEYAGFTSKHYQLVDASLDQVPHTFARGHAQQTVSKHWSEADVRVTFGKMRTNPSWLVDLSLDALDSLGKRVDELLFHDRQADLVSGLMMLLEAFPPHLSLLDATHHVPQGLTGILGEPRPCHPGRLYAAVDPVSLDLTAARHMGLRSFPRGGALATSVDWFDDPQAKIHVDGLDTPIADFQSPHRNDFTVLLSMLAYPVYMIGHRGNLWLPVMDSHAFPLKKPATLLERVLRPTLRTLFRFGKPPSRP